MKFLSVASIMQLNRLCKKHSIEKISLGKGKSNVFNYVDIERAVNERGGTKIKKEVLTPKEKVKTISPLKKEKPLLSDEKEPDTILNDNGKREYARIKEILSERGDFLDIDESILQAYSIAYQNYFAFSYQITICGGLTVDQAGNKTPSLYIKMADTFFKQMMNCCKTLGIGAANRKFDIKEAEKTSSILDFCDES